MTLDKKKNKLKKNIKIIENYIKNPKKGLPEELFLFLTRISPMINVDLLIKNNFDETLLTWRKKGEKYPSGWHIPGGIIRFKEKIHSRVKEVANSELNCKINFSKNPIMINQIFLNQKNRSHFISLLFLCKLKSKLDKNIKYKSGIPKIGQWKWFSRCPKNIIKPHKKYKKFI
tara:strand:- start:1581 stop:2099 length:519 start_codon:yes stop_codon:yes gene_type:complete